MFAKVLPKLNDWTVCGHNHKSNALLVGGEILRVRKLNDDPLDKRYLCKFPFNNRWEYVIWQDWLDFNVSQDRKDYHIFFGALRENRKEN